jgi:protocatechuate 3,4-dioxygenase beta subunit
VYHRRVIDSETRNSSKIWILAAVLTAVAVALLGWKVLGGASETDEAGAARETSTAGEGPFAQVADGRDMGARVDLKLASKAVISGTVHDDQGRPIVGAHVCAFPERRQLRGAGEPDPRCTRTGADGSYRVEGLWPVATEVSASAPKYQPASWKLREADGSERREVRLRAGETREHIDIELAPGGVALRGKVLDIAGGEIEGARVRTGSSWWRRGVGIAVAFTDDAGEFELWVAPGTLEVLAASEGYADGEVEAVAPGEYVELFLTPESILIGRVVLASSGEPVAGVTVDVEGKQTQSEADGTFRVDGLEPGTYKPSARSDEFYGQAAEQVHLGLGATSEPVEIRVHPAALVEGRIVVAGSGAGCKEGYVRLSEKDEKSEFGRVAGDDGRVELRGVLPGTYEVTVDCSGYVPEDEYPDVVVAEENLVGLVWEVREGLAIRGEVVDEAGEPVAGVLISARPVVDPASARAQVTHEGDRSDEDGRFELAGLLPGRYEVHAGTWRPERPGPLEPVSVELEPGADLNDVRVVMPASGKLRGRVVDEQGEPVSGAELHAVLIAGDDRAQTRSNDAGEFEFAHLRPGETRVVATDGGSWWRGSSMRKPGTTDDDLQGEVVSVVADETAEVELVVEARGGVIRGIVTDEGGGPVADAFIDVERMPDRAGANAAAARRSVRWSWGSQPVLTEPDGRFELRDLPEGEFIIRGHRRGGGEAVAENVALGQEVALVIASTGELAGRVLLADGGAPERFKLAAQDKQNGVYRGDNYFRTDGVFRLTELPAGTYELTVTAAGGTVVETVELGEGEVHEGIELRLDPRLTIRGRIVDLDTREPVAGMEVVASTGGAFAFGRSKGERRNVSGSDGRFELDNAPSGRVQLVAFDRAGGQDRKYDMLWHSLNLPPEPLEQDIGDIEIVARRLESNQEAGDTGFRLRDWDPSVEAEDRMAKVAFVRPGGPAAAVGLEPGDVIETVDGHDVLGPNFSRYGGLIQAPPGTTLELGIRGGKQVSLTLGPPI